MSNEKMFEVATRNGFRFQFKGLITVEDLWQLSVRDLDTIFKSLNSQVKQAKEESLLNTKTKEDEVVDIKIEIIKYIVSVKQQEEELRLKAKSIKEEKQKLYSILDAKQEAELQNKSAEEIQKMIDELGQ